MKKYAFTMIELIFVIVILGILAAIAIPKLSATRDDALVSKELANAKIIKVDMINKYNATGVDVATRKSDCFTFSFNNGLLTVVKSSNNGAIYCHNVYDVNQSINLLIPFKLNGLKVKF